MHRRSTLILFLFLAALTARSQEAAELWEKPYSLSIQDNSFFIEEAFNQEARVVQHISSVAYFRKPRREIVYSFTQEWPLGSSKHQLSYEIPYLSNGYPHGSRVSSGVGDVVINYRYQLTDKPDGVAFSPRFSLIFPTGDDREGLGMGAMGFEVSLPASKRLSEAIAAHVNLGVTIYPSVEVQVNDPVFLEWSYARRVIPAYFMGASVIYLAHPSVNFLVEWVTSFTGEPDPRGEVKFAASHIVSPGVRAALNFGDLQVVPGAAVPVRFHDGVSETGVFGYLSFEHGF